MDRRTFIKAGTVGAAASTVLQPGCATESPTGQTGTGSPQLPDFPLEEATVAGIQEGLASGEWTARSLTEAYLERIELVDRGLGLNSVIETNPDAVRIAEELDAERRNGGSRGPLHGVPVLIKDNIATADGMETTAGSHALLSSRPARDAFLASRLREAGAVILGKANLSEWANFRSTNSVSGWSGRGGQCKNPYALDRNPCGSSSGSGAAASANLATLAVGTETNGSVVCPSSASGLVGIKPTVGLVSRSGIIPISHTQDTAGPMCRTVVDAATLLTVLAGVDPADPATARSSGNAAQDYAAFADPGGLAGARIGVVRSGGFGPKVEAVFEDALAAMRSEGATLVDPVELPHMSEIGRYSYQVLLYEFKTDLNAYLAALASTPVVTLEDIIAFNDANASLEMPYFGQEIMIQAQEKGGLDTPEYLEAVERAPRLAGPEGIDRVMDEHRLDALVAPTGGPAWTTDLVNGDHFGGGSSSSAAVSGYPNITLPMGMIFGLPVGLSIWGRAWSEPTLIRLAAGFEAVTGVREAPRFLETADLRI